jgi:uncharacterized membrane protein
MNEDTDEQMRCDMRRRLAILCLAAMLTMVIMASPAVASGYKYCSSGQYMSTWGTSGGLATHGHQVNGWITYRTGESTSVIHPAPPTVRPGWNYWDVTNVTSESGNCGYVA